MAKRLQSKGFYLLSDDVELEGGRALVCKTLSVDVINHDLVVSTSLTLRVFVLTVAIRSS